VGSVVAVGLVGGEKGKAVNWRLFTGIIASWVITLPVAGGISALIYWAIRPLVTAVYPH
jgi:phosphate/sulfate permease